MTVDELGAAIYCELVNIGISNIMKISEGETKEDAAIRLRTMCNKLACKIKNGGTL